MDPTLLQARNIVRNRLPVKLRSLPMCWMPMCSLMNGLMVTRGKGRGKGIVREFGIDTYTLLYLKWITNKDLLYNTGNSAQYYVTT